MFNQLCQDIRDLTLQAAELQSNKEIEDGLALLVKRQTLLEQLQALFISAEDNSKLYTPYTSLLLWVQKQDAINSAKIIEFREQSKHKSVHQAQIKKALNHYKNLT